MQKRKKGRDDGGRGVEVERGKLRRREGLEKRGDNTQTNFKMWIL